MFSRPVEDPAATFDILVTKLRAHDRARYLTITDCIPDHTLNEPAVVAIVCELTPEGEAELIQAGLL